MSEVPRYCSRRRSWPWCGRTPPGWYTYGAFWHTELTLSLGDLRFALDLQYWVNDGLMAFFFFVVGLEVKRELVIGELAERRRAAVPVAAALAGLVVPALLYVALNLGGSSVGALGGRHLHRYGLPAGPARPAGVGGAGTTTGVPDGPGHRRRRGGLLIIAVFYTQDLRLGAVAMALLGLAAMFGAVPAGVARHWLSGAGRRRLGRVVPFGGAPDPTGGGHGPCPFPPTGRAATRLTTPRGAPAPTCSRPTPATPRLPSCRSSGRCRWESGCSGCGVRGRTT